MLIGLSTPTSVAARPAAPATSDAQQNEIPATRIRNFSRTQDPTVRSALTQILSNARRMAELNAHVAHDELAATIRKVDSAQAHPAGAVQRERLDSPIGNFGEVVPGELYRGAQPTREGLRWLQSQGIKTIVILREPGVEETNYPGYSRADYLRDIRSLGMTPVEIPIKDHTLPRREQVEAFLRTVGQAANQPAFVHCSAGIGRTGIMAGAYLKSQGVPMKDILAHCHRFGLTWSKPDHAAQLRYIERFNPQS